MDMVNNKAGDAAADAGAAAADAGAATPDHDYNKSYKGVRKRKWGKWVSEIRLPNSRERIWLGSYDSPQKAARAFDAALYCLRGCRANFNFPDTPFNLMDINVSGGRNQTLTPAEIQVVAARFANEYPSNQEGEEEPSQFVPQSGTNSSSESKVRTDSSSSSNASTMYECTDGTKVQLGHDGDSNNNNNVGEMDWAFLNVLDDDAPSNYYKDVIVDSDHDYGFYSSLDNMHSGEFLYSTFPPPFQDNVDQIEGSDPFSHQSSLWNWSF